ncbi:hypothetical protein ACEWY4_010244 [Coilia grayii]|uniref:PiggyBac transposable element-derived protein domain-containing protein n=1 Tax=Coilia grayii TaxID=363190 RepID=A0ABD1K1D0_9TELE
MQYLHFVDLNDEDGDDRFSKIRPVLDVLQTTFLAIMEPKEFQSIDEQIIPFKGKHSTKQYIPKKPKPWLLKELKKQGIEATGTCRANRLMGAQAKLKDKKTLTEEGRGASSVVTSEGNTTVTRWLDRQVIHVVSKYAGKYPQDVDRWTKKEKKVIQILRLHAIKKRSRGRSSDTSLPPVAKKVTVTIPGEIRYSPGHHWPLLMDMKNVSRCRDEICQKRTK